MIISSIGPFSLTEGLDGLPNKLATVQVVDVQILNLVELGVVLQVPNGLWVQVIGVDNAALLGGRQGKGSHTAENITDPLALLEHVH